MTGHVPDSSLMHEQLHKHGIDEIDISVFAQLESTSQWLREKPVATTDSDSTDTTPHLCVTDSQIAGVGRRGKTWQTLPGNITFSVRSVSCRPSQELMGLSLVTGIAVADALSDALSLCVELKWPNDVIHKNTKLGGVLTEVVTLKSAERAVPRSMPSESLLSEIITGVGLNVVHDPAISALGIGATSLEEAGVSLSRGNRDRLIGTITASILDCHRRFDKEGWAPFENQWKQLDWLADKDVSIHGQSSTEHAIARGVNKHGALLVEREGDVKPLYGGQVSIRLTV